MYDLTKEPINSSAHLPSIDTSTPETWASTFAARIIKYAELHKQHGSVVLPLIDGGEEPHSEAGQEYDLANFNADSFVGDLPWGGTTGDAVDALLMKDEAFQDAHKQLWGQRFEDYEGNDGTEKE